MIVLGGSATIPWSRAARAQQEPFRGWNLVPTITVVSTAGDPRLPLVEDAVAFWNDTFAERGTPFRLGASTQVVGAIPVEDLKMLSNFVLTGEPPRELMPESLKRIDGNIVVALSEGEFISFTARWAAYPVPRTVDGGIDLMAVTAIEIVAVEDYH